MTAQIFLRLVPHGLLPVAFGEEPVCQVSVAPITLVDFDKEGSRFAYPLLSPRGQTPKDSWSRISDPIF